MCASITLVYTSSARYLGRLGAFLSSPRRTLLSTLARSVPAYRSVRNRLRRTPPSHCCPPFPLTSGYLRGYRVPPGDYSTTTTGLVVVGWLNFCGGGSQNAPQQPHWPRWPPYQYLPVSR